MFIIAGVKSSSGKTVLTLGLMEALRKKGLIVAPFKAGPDYIDPGLHKRALGRPSYNLDTWMMGPGGVKKTFAAHAAGADVAIVEGVMGLFDGKGDGKACDGSTASLARLLKLPVILVVDASGMAASAAALVKGFVEYDKGVNVACVIFNRVASERHRSLIEKAASRLKNVEVLGFVPDDKTLKLPSRHLGLVTSEDIAGKDWRIFLKNAARMAEEHVDLERLLKISRKPKGVAPGVKASSAKSVKIGVARDNAFCFYYEESLDILKNLGAELVYFSPVSDKAFPTGVSGLYIGGGYPELYAKKLEANSLMRRAIKKAVEKNMPVFAECGGLQYLAKKLVDIEGKSFDMAGVFPFSTRMLKKRKALGYRLMDISKACPFLPEGGLMRGHEFHYSEITGSRAGFVKAFNKNDGFLRKNALAGYAHLHFASNPGFAKGFLKACRAYGALKP